MLFYARRSHFLCQSIDSACLEMHCQFGHFSCINSRCYFGRDRLKIFFVVHNLLLRLGEKIKSSQVLECLTWLPSFRIFLSKSFLALMSHILLWSSVHFLPSLTLRNLNLNLNTCSCCQMQEFVSQKHFSTVINSPPYFNCNFNIRNLLWGFSISLKIIYFVSIYKYSHLKTNPNQLNISRQLKQIKTVKKKN